MKNLGYYNGNFDEIENIYIPMNDRACYFGDGVYDAAYSRNYKIFGLDAHIDRLFNSARLLEIKIPKTKQEFKELLQEMVNKMDTGDNFVYFQVTRGTDKIRNHVFCEGEANIWINIYPKKVVDIQTKVKLITVEDTRFLHCNIKTLNLLPSVMAAQKAKEAGCFEAVLHRAGRVTECSHCNVHILKNSTFITAPCDNLILPGITRAQLIAICKQLNIDVCERAFSVEEMMDADEVMISSVSTLCLAAEEIDGKAVGGKDTKTLKLIQNAILKQYLEETK